MTSSLLPDPLLHRSASRLPPLEALPSLPFSRVDSSLLCLPTVHNQEEPSCTLPHQPLLGLHLRRARLPLPTTPLGSPTVLSLLHPLRRCLPPGSPFDVAGFFHRTHASASLDAPPNQISISPTPTMKTKKKKKTRLRAMTSFPHALALPHIHSLFFPNFIFSPPPSSSPAAFHTLKYFIFHPNFPWLHLHILFTIATPRRTPTQRHLIHALSPFRALPPATSGPNRGSHVA